MSRYETEEEQVEAIKAWWKKNGTQLLSGVLVLVIAVSGWRFWDQYQTTQATNASAVFEVLQLNMQQGTFGEVSREGLKLMQEQPESPYAAGAALLVAKYHFEKGDYAQAQEPLQWVLDHSSDSSLKQVATLRKARIFADQQQLEEAKSTLDTLNRSQLTGASVGIYDYVSGLLALSQGQDVEAFDAFEKVVGNPDASKTLKGIAQLQLDDLPRKSNS